MRIYPEPLYFHSCDLAAFAGWRYQQLQLDKQCSLYYLVQQVVFKHKRSCLLVSDK